MGENSTAHDEGCSVTPQSHLATPQSHLATPQSHLATPQSHLATSGDPTQEVTMEKHEFTQLMAKATRQLKDLIDFTTNMQHLPETEMQQAAAAIMAKWETVDADTPAEK